MDGRPNWREKPAFSNSSGLKSVFEFKPVFTCDASISINISIRRLCASEDSRDISISISFLLIMLMLMLKFSEDIVDISISARSLTDSLTLMLSQYVLIGH